MVGSGDKGGFHGVKSRGVGSAGKGQGKPVQIFGEAPLIFGAGEKRGGIAIDKCLPRLLCRCILSLELG